MYAQAKISPSWGQVGSMLAHLSLLGAFFRSWVLLMHFLSTFGTPWPFFWRPGALWVRFWKLPSLIFRRFLGLSLLFCLTNALIAALNPNWHLLRLFVPPCSAAVRAQHMESMSQKTCNFSSIFLRFFHFVRNLDFFEISVSPRRERDF